MHSESPDILGTGMDTCGPDTDRGRGLDNGPRKRAERWAKYRMEEDGKVHLCKCGCGIPVKKLQKFSSQYRDFAQGHDRRSPAWNYRLSEQERQAILGTLLGDSSIVFPNRGSNAPRIVCNHGIRQEGWCRHKAAFLSNLLPSISVHPNGGYGDTIISMATKCSESLVDVYESVCFGGEKRISDKWLDGIGAIGLAWWIGDDGSSGTGSSLTLHTEGYRFDDIDIIASWIGRNYGPVTVATSKKRYRNIYIKAEARRSILPVVERHLPEFMQYKLRACRKHPKKRQDRCI